MFDANTALSHLVGVEKGGYGRLVCMIGAKSFAKDENSVSFRIPMKCKNKANYCKVSLAGNDTYTVEFGYIRGGKYTVRSVTEGLYNDMLKTHFETETANYLSL